MRPAEFALERFFARWEFAARHVLCASDVEPLRLDELLAASDDESLRLWRELRLGYTETAGHPLLREEIARDYARVGADGVLAFAGAEEGIFLLVQTAVERGDHVLCTWPAYQSLYEVARAAGAEVELLPLRQEEGWRLEPERLRRAIRPATRLVVLNFPHNPTGALPAPDEWEALVGVAREAGCRLLSDEVYRGLERDPAARLAPAADLYDRAASLGVMSKAYGLAGLRVGWAASRDAEWLARAAAYKDYTSICNAAPSEVLALAALRGRESLLARSRAIVEPNLAALGAFVDARPELLAWAPPRAGATAFPRLLADVPAERLAGELVEETGVLLLPGTCYGHHGNHFRIGFGRRDFTEGLERLAAWMDARFAGRSLTTA